MRNHDRTRLVLAPIAAATLAIGMSDGSDVDGQIDDELDNVDDDITSEVPADDNDDG